MESLPRWTVEELAARYELEPHLKDVFTEGTFDKEILSRCFENLQQNHRIAYEIDGVDIPPKLLAQHGLTNGNKQRVIVLARELAALTQAKCAYRCLVDRDLDYWFGRLEVTPRLVWTDHCSIEAYFFSDDILRDVLLVAARVRVTDWGQLVQSLTEVLRTLFSFRLASHELSWRLKWLPVDRCLTSAGSRLVLDIPEYIDRLLMKNRVASLKRQFEETRAGWESQLKGDPRSYIHGHDFVKLLAWIVREFRGQREFASEVSVERLLVLLAPRTNLNELISGF